MTNTHLILASQSPRRRELLGLTGLPFEVITADIDETPHAGESARDYTIRLSREKACAIINSPDHTLPDHTLVLAADTTVADGDAIIGKPADAAEARSMLRQLRNRTHQVYTALTVIDATTGLGVTEIGATDVPMRDYSDDEIETYIASGDPFDKAGGYAVQNTDFNPAPTLNGCYANVMGLPLCHVIRALRAFKIVPDVDIAARCQQHIDYDCTVFDQILMGPTSAPREVSIR
ncbi:MAG: septum formation protein Maf [Anaerolineae bacterium]|nr:septum formation protein Maf [Anaerolineae bacterium]